MQMKVFVKNALVFAAVFVLLETAGCDSGFQVVQKPSDDEAWALHEKDLFSPGEAGERMEIEIEGVMTAFRWAPPGSFTRRWNKSTECEWEKETEWDDDEKDYKVTLTQGFWLAETETTQALWKAVMENNPSLGGRVRKAPVNNVSWEDAQEFISKLNGGGYAPAGFEFCLPTEAQWEYACMAGSADDRCGELDAIAWYGANSEKHAHEVGQKEANAWGFYDMLGNVCEWCGDWYGKYPMDDLTDYAGPQSGSNRVIRGGGWTGDAESCRSFYRLTDWDGWDGVSDSNLGFRLCLVPMAVGPSALSEEDLASPARAGARVAVEIMGVNTAFRWAPPGSFTRHWDLTTGRYWEWKTDPDDDRKDFEITLTQGFWLAETETTQELWQAVMGNNPSPGLQTPKSPVSEVSWEATQEFISKLNEGGYIPTGYEFRLPTEAQWEYACMAGSTDDLSRQLNVFAWNYLNTDRRTDRDWRIKFKPYAELQPHEVGRKRANAWGLYDMLGNVEEWCYDWYANYPRDDLTDYSGPKEGSKHVIRGGDCFSGAKMCNHSYRISGSREGFRLAIVPKEE